MIPVTRYHTRFQDLRSLALAENSKERHGYELGLLITFAVTLQIRMTDDFESYDSFVFGPLSTLLLLYPSRQPTFMSSIAWPTLPRAHHFVSRYLAALLLFLQLSIPISNVALIILRLCRLLLTCRCHPLLLLLLHPLLKAGPKQVNGLLWILSKSCRLQFRSASCVTQDLQTLVENLDELFSFSPPERSAQCRRVGSERCPDAPQRRCCFHSES